MTNVIPTLSLNGWVDNKELQMTKIFEYFLSSDYSQSDSFYGLIGSMKFILSNYKGSQNIKEAMNKSLSAMYEAYFDAVTIDIIIDEPETTSVTNYTINIVAVYNNTSYDFSKIITADVGGISNFNTSLDALYEEYNNGE